MDIDFNNESPTILEGLGITEERFNEIKKPLLGLKMNKAISAVIEAGDLSDNEKLGVVFELGANFGQRLIMNEINRATDAQVMQQLAENAKAEGADKQL